MGNSYIFLVEVFDLTEESSRGFSTSIYIRDKTAFQECKRLLELQGKSMSEEFADFISTRLAELKGSGSTLDSADSVRRLQSLKKTYGELKANTVRLDRELKTSRSKDFDKATHLLVQLGLKRDFSNVDELTPKFISAWKGDEAFMHEFLNLLELARDKKRVLQALTAMRSPGRSEPFKPEPSQFQGTAPEPDLGKVQKHLPVSASHVSEAEEEDDEEDADLAEEDHDEAEDLESEEEFEEDGFESEPGKPTVTVLTEEKNESADCTAIVPLSSEDDENDD